MRFMMANDENSQNLTEQKKTLDSVTAVLTENGNAQSKGLALFEKSFELALKIPGVKIKRTHFLEHQLRPYLADEKIVTISKSKTFNLVEEKILDCVADATIKNHVRAVTALSAASGAPANPVASVGLAAADLAQYFAQVLMLAQKIAYIYGFPDLLDENDNFTEVSRSMLFVLLAVAFGCKIGDQKLRLVLQALAKGVEKKLPQKALMSTWWYPILKKIAPWFAKKMTKEKLGKIAGKVIPFLGVPISGSITYFSFKKAAKHLKNECKLQMVFFKQVDKQEQNPSKDESLVEEGLL